MTDHARDAAELAQLFLLKLEKFGDVQQWSHNEAWHALPESVRQSMADQVHRKFRYIVCRWLQEQGASVVR